MKIAKTHRRLLSNRSFRFGCEKSVFSPAEIAALEKFGHVMEALVAGKIRAVTPDEKRFVLLAVGKEPRPGNTWEKAWAKLQGRREFEQSNRESPHYIVYPVGEDWFPRSAIGKINLPTDLLGPTPSDFPASKKRPSRKRKKPRMRCRCPFCGQFRFDLDAHVRAKHPDRYAALMP